MSKTKMPAEEKDSVHPVAILKQAAWITGRNLKLGAVYLIFSLPVSIFSISPAANPDKKGGLSIFLWLALVFVIDSWGKIALFLSASRAIDSRDYGILEIINQSGQFLARYLGLVLGLFLLTLSAFIVGIVLTSLAGTWLWQLNNVIAVLAMFAVLFAVIAVLVFFLLRWSFATLVCVLEDKGVISSLKRSFALIKDRINPLVATYLLMGLVYLISVLPLLAAAGLQGRSISQATLGLGANTYILLANIYLVPLGTVFAISVYNKFKEVSNRNVHA